MERREACNSDVECQCTVTCPRTCQCSRCRKGTSNRSLIPNHSLEREDTATEAIPSKYEATDSQPEVTAITENGNDAKDMTDNVQQAEQSVVGPLLSDTSQSSHETQTSFNISTESFTVPKADACLSLSAEKNSSVEMAMDLRTRSCYKEQPQEELFRINPHASTTISIERKYNLRPRETFLKEVKRTESLEGLSRLKNSTKILKHSSVRNPHRENLFQESDLPLANELQKYSSIEEASDLCQMEISNKGLSYEILNQMKQNLPHGLNPPKREFLQSHPAPLREKNPSVGVLLDMRTRSSLQREQFQGSLIRLNPRETTLSTAVSFGKQYNLRPRETVLKEVKHTDFHEGRHLTRSRAKSHHSSSNEKTRSKTFQHQEISRTHSLPEKLHINKVSSQISSYVSSTGSRVKHSSPEETNHHPYEAIGSPRNSSRRKIHERCRGIHISAIKCSENNISLQRNESIEKSVNEPTTSAEGKSTSDVKISAESFLSVLSKECPVSSSSISPATTKSNNEKSKFIIHSVSSNVNLSDNPITSESALNVTNRSKTYAPTITVSVNNSVSKSKACIISPCISSCSTREISLYSTRGIPLSYASQRFDSKQNSRRTCFVMTDSPPITEGHLSYSPRESPPKYEPRVLPLGNLQPGTPVSNVPRSMPPSNLLPLETQPLWIFAPSISPQGTLLSYLPFQYSGQNSNETFSVEPVLHSTISNQIRPLLNVSSIPGYGGVFYKRMDPTFPYFIRNFKSLDTPGGSNSLFHPRELDFSCKSESPTRINASEELMNFPSEQNPSLCPVLLDSSRCSSGLPSVILQSEDSAFKINSSGSSISQKKLSSLETPVVLESSTSPQKNLGSLSSFPTGEDRYTEQVDGTCFISDEDDSSFISDESESVILTNVDISSFLSSDDVSNYLSSEKFASRESTNDC